jgi:hypothetical protein
MNRTITALIGIAAAAGLGFAGLTLAASPFSDPVLIDIEAHRDDDGVCRGEAHWAVSAKDADITASVGARTMGLHIELPCARLDEVAALTPVGARKKMVVTVRAALLYVDGDGTCKMQLARAVTPADEKMARVVGTRVISDNPVVFECAKMKAAIVDAVAVPIVLQDGSFMFDWPVSDIALPLPVKK